MLPEFVIGIDISKLTLDVAVLKDRVLVQTRKIENSEAGLKQLLAALRSDHDCTPENTVYCAEHMGIYAKFIREVLGKKNIRLCLETPLQIKLSLGIQRGKNDKVDSIRIAEYAKKNISSLRFWEPPRPYIVELKALMSIRQKLLKMRGMLKLTKKMESHFLAETERRDIGAYTQASLKAIVQDVKVIEKEMTAIIQMDAHLSELTKLLTSIPFIGKIVATQIIILTNEFKDFTSPKKFASYCGIAPFEKSSGTSLRRKPRISHIANKDMKMLLHLAALGATRKGRSPFRTYYARKVKEGKHRMSVLNAIRNKLVTVIFACVRENKPYESSVRYQQQPPLPPD